MRYPFSIESDGEFFLVTFPNVPEAITQGESLEEAELAAPDALATALDFYLEQGRDLPVPSPLKHGERFIEIPAASLARSA